MLCQEFDFKIRFIKGELNTIADAFFRLCRNLEAERLKQLESVPASSGGGLPAEEAENTSDDIAAEMVMQLRE